MSLLDIENEIQFHFQLEIVPSRQVGSQQIENAGPKREQGGYNQCCLAHCSRTG
ncbi:MAG TPA: hypothetical protein VGP65_01355 [Candidatus Angelobacter sp.]|jgi:hypothetical protein|nr:hypothetical protein [Candidatus Angelobacter sp.]